MLFGSLESRGFASEVAQCKLHYMKVLKFASVRRRGRSLSGYKVLSTMHYALCTMHYAKGSKFASVRRRWRSGFEVCMPGMLGQLTTHQLDLRDGRRLFREILNWDKSGCRACPAAEEERKETNQISGCTEVSGPQLGIWGRGGMNQISY